jgi:hypothetical protein
MAISTALADVPLLLQAEPLLQAKPSRQSAWTN